MIIYQGIAELVCFFGEEVGFDLSFFTPLFISLTSLAIRSFSTLSAWYSFFLLRSRLCQQDVNIHVRDVNFITNTKFFPRRLSNSPLK